MKKQLVAVAVLLAFAFAIGRCRCHDDAPLGFGSWAQQGQAASTSFAGVIDPTAPSGWLGTVGMTACESSCSSTVADQNTAALQATVTYAATNGRKVYVPRGRYPMTLTSGQTYAVTTSGKSNVDIEAYGATFMLQGDQTGTAGAIIEIKNGSHVHIEGARFSMRDATNTGSSTTMVRVGDSGSTSVDDVRLVDVAFIEGVGSSSNCLSASGGSSSATVTRLSVTRASRFEACAEAIHLKGGVDQVSINFSWFKTNTGRDIWLELHSSLGPSRVTMLGNNFDHASATNPVSVDLNGSNLTFQYNRILDGTIAASGISKLSITDNPELYLNAAQSNAVIAVAGGATDVRIERNFVKRTSSASNGIGISVTSSGGSAPVDVWVSANRVQQYSGNSAGIDASGTTRLTAIANSVSYNSSTTDSGSTGFAGIKCAGTATSPCSGTFARNHIVKAKLTDGTTDAGRMLAGIDIRKGGASTVGTVRLRDNYVDGAASTYYSDAEGPTEFPSGYPLVNGNIAVNVATDGFAGGTTTWIAETTPLTETKTSGALDITKATSFLTTANTQSYTLADAVQDGFVHCVKVKSVSGSPAGTLTPAHFADGSTHTLTWTAAGGHACLTWDAASALYRLRSIDSSITLN